MKIITIPNGVDLDAAENKYPTDVIRKRLGLADDAQVILDITNIKPVKGVDVLARTAAIVCRKFPKAMFLVAGRPADQRHMVELEHLVRTLGIEEKFRFIGAIDNPYAILQMTYIFCHLSRTDGLSNALLESMASGVPAVVSRAGGNAEVIEEGASGFVVPVEHSELAADRIITLLRYPDCAARLGARARYLAEQHFSSKAMAGRFVDLYDELLARNHKH